MMIGHWFWDGTPPRDLSQLLTFYYTSVGRNSLLMLNVAPDHRGQFSEGSVARLHEFHAALQSIFGQDIAAGKKASASNVRGHDSAFRPENALDGDRTTYWATDDDVTSGSMEVDLAGEFEFNVVRTEEMIGLGQRVEQYKIEVGSGASLVWKAVAQGTTIGYRKLDRFPRTRASKLRLIVLKARACLAIKSFGVHLDTISPPESFEPANANYEYKRPPRTQNSGARNKSAEKK
jgi:alpha-L-fucosidase